jgi:hypothetical protein
LNNENLSADSQFDILFPCMVDMGIDMGLDIGKKESLYYLINKNNTYFIF